MFTLATSLYKYAGIINELLRSVYYTMHNLMLNGISCYQVLQEYA